MQVYRNTDLLPVFRNAVLTIGTFDGVHSGHQQVINQMKRRAADVNGETVIVTFDPHPRTIVKAADGIRLINTLDEKIELLSDKGIDHLVIIPFTEKFARLSAEDYISQFLIRHFQPHTLIIGYDHHFGNGRSGNYELLKEQSAIYHYQLQEIPAHLLDSISVSSTRIRKAVEAGDMETANHFLGYTYFFSGEVVEGNKLGRTLGYPTANLLIGEKSKLIPGDGVYAVDIVVSDEPDKTYRGMMNIGYRPTVDGSKKMIEVHIFQFDRMIYGRILRVFVKKFLRHEQKFSGLEALKAQMAEDKKNASPDI
ncbi:MAG TPA: riboflavin biosynthesis protein RibF [Chitinophagaceae bacterium]|jgi:riboflavin kinase / FMN adenylyltransferase|nr:riboflavin biosynthesis protein RibF [Chitinophagaceae bacterium]